MSTALAVDVAVSRHVAAAPQTLYDLVSDVTLMSRWSPETVGATRLDGATAAGRRRPGQPRRAAVCRRPAQGARRTASRP